MGPTLGFLLGGACLGTYVYPGMEVRCQQEKREEFVVNFFPGRLQRERPSLGGSLVDRISRHCSPSSSLLLPTHLLPGGFHILLQS